MGKGGTTMTPTLIGRWQTRVYLLWTVGLLITLFYMAVFGVFNHVIEDPSYVTTQTFWKLPLLLFYVTLFGLVWDWLYIYLQSYRWDADWPLAFQFACTLLEGVFVYILFASNLLPFVTYEPQNDWWHYILHYGTIWWVTFWWLFGPMRVMFPRWRFRGGRVL
jgi:hypothetical protein